MTTPTFVAAELRSGPAPVVAASRVVWVLAALKLILHIATAGRYGIFRDEMYVLACARHLDWGYIEHPPGGILIGWVARHLLGESLLGLRFLPALAGAALVVLTGKLTRELGGRPFAQAFAALAVCVAPIYLIFDHWLTMNAFEPLIWMGAVYCVLRAINTDDGRYWLGFGVLLGIGLETKYSIVLLAVGLMAGLALSPQRRWFADARLWVGLLIAALIALPNFIWQLCHGFPFLEFRHDVALHQRDVVRGPLAFMLDQMRIMQPVTAPLWVAGLVGLIAGSERRRYGVFGVAYLVVVAAFITLKGKNYYPTPAYPMLFAAGAILFDRLVERAHRPCIRPAYAAVMGLGGLVLLPMFVPLLSPETFIRYQGWLRIDVPAAEHQNTGPLPQYFADEFGWQEMVREVARVYHALPPEERKRTAIFANDWAEAAAVDLYGPQYGLPPAISKHNSYWLWGPGDATGEIVIVLRSDGVGDRKVFQSVEKVGRVQHPYSRRDEWFDVFLCRGLTVDFRTLWPALKTFG